MILVTGGTGKVGLQLINALQAKGASFRALARSEGSARVLAGMKIQVVRGDLGDLAGLKAALQETDRLFLLSSAPRCSGLELPVIDLAKAAGVKHVVKLSALGSQADSSNPLFREHARIERALETSGMAFTILRPTFFMQNWLVFFAQSIKAGQPVFINAGDARLGWIDTRDIAAVAAEALTGSWHEGLVYDLTGPETFSHKEVAAKLSRLLAKPVSYVPVSDAQAFQAMKGMGMDEWYAYGMVALYQGVRKGLADVTTGTVELVTGRHPRSMDAFLAEHAESF